MKTKMKIIAVCLLSVVSITSCDKYRDDVLVDETMSQKLAQENSEYQVMSMSGSYSELEVSPKFGKPNNTNFQFRVYDPSGTVPLSVKLFEMATGANTYVPMTKSGSYWTVTRKMPTNGWFHYRYVFTSTNVSVSPSTPAYQMCVTRNVFTASGISKLTWPFGADNSTFANRTVFVNGKSQEWRAGSYGGGAGWNDYKHTGVGEQYSMDWNRGDTSSWNANDDLGAEIRSPLDGTIVAFNTYSTEYGPAKQVIVKQIGSDGIHYQFAFGHLQDFASGLYNGMYVKAGVTKLGTLGKSGASTPHAHCNMRNQTTGVGLKFELDAP